MIDSILDNDYFNSFENEEGDKNLIFKKDRNISSSIAHKALNELTDCLNTWAKGNKNTIKEATPLEKAIKRGKAIIEELKEIQKIIQKRIVHYQKDKEKYNLDKEETENINSDIGIFKENLEYIKNMINDISKDLLTIKELDLTKDKIEKLEEDWEKLIDIAKTYSPS